MKKIALSLFYILFFQTTVFASLSEKYPHYRYVFSEFGVELNYIDNGAFEIFVHKYEKNLQTFYRLSMHRAKAFLPQMQRMLVEEGLTDLFIYLSMIESGFLADAKSSKKAVGLWQFIPNTAKSYNLVVEKNYDERCDISCSTTAAMKHLKRLHKKFSHWYLAILAYNCGEGRLAKAIRRAGTTDLSTLLSDTYKYLPYETRKYLQKILLISMIGESKHLDFPVEEEDALMEVEIAGGTQLARVAQIVDMNLSTLLALNPQFHTVQVPLKKVTYSLNLPEEQMMLFYLKYEPSLLPKCSYTHLLSYQVKLGDTLQSIAQTYQTTQEGIQKANHLTEPYLEMNRLLVIPVEQALFERFEKL